MSGYEIAEFLEGILYDILNPGQADLVSLLFRILATFFAFVVVWGLVQLILGTVWKLFSELVGALPRLPTGSARKLRKQRRKEEKEQEAYMKEQEAIRVHMRAEEARREAQRQAELDKVLKALEIKKE